MANSTNVKRHAKCDIENTEDYDEFLLTGLISQDFDWENQTIQFGKDVYWGVSFQRAGQVEADGDKACEHSFYFSRLL